MLFLLVMLRPINCMCLGLPISNKKQFPKAYNKSGEDAAFYECDAYLEIQPFSQFKWAVMFTLIEKC